LLALSGCGNGSWLDLGNALLSGKDTGRTAVLAAAADVQVLAVASAGGDSYEMFDLGPTHTGDDWTFFAGSTRFGAFVLAVLDDEQRLLERARLTERDDLRHIVRRDTEHLYAAVWTAGTADFTLVAARGPAVEPLAPAAQVVWLNFAGADHVQINAQPETSFGPFEAADLGPAYAGQTTLITAAITRTVRALYADYNVLILSSDETPEPAQPHSTVHFGATDATYVGLGDGVDRYNRDPRDQAIVYTHTFARYATMDLGPEDMARMVGNTAGHELGHLLGLFHARGSQNVMDDTRSAWDLAAESFIAQAPLAETVFPIGVEDAPTVLADTVGRAD
jgi:hypothetical protein